MTQKYTQQNIDQFFSRFKELPISYSIEKVHQLINDPNAKATHSPKQFFKPFKFKLFIMTSALIIGLSALWFWPTTDEPSITNSMAKQYQQTVEEFQNNQLKPNAMVQNSQKNAALSSSLLTEKSADSETNQNGTFQFVDSTLNTSGVDSLASSNPYQMPNLDALCSWPVDTTIDKHKLFLYLSNEEFQKLGVYKSNDTMHYFNFSNITKAVNMISCNRNDVIDREKLPKTQFEFRLLYKSNLSCTTYRWGHPFYNEIDTLIPIVSRLGNEEQIFWFNAHPSIFQKLPEKYSGLASVYQNLSRVKKKNPNHQIVNYWSKENNVGDIKPELNEKQYNLVVPVIHLTEDEMSKLGFEFYDDSVKFIFKDGCNKYTCKYLKPKSFHLTRDSANIIKEGYSTAKSLEFDKSIGLSNKTMTLSSKSTVSTVCGEISLKDNTAILLRAYTNEDKSEFKESIWVYDEDMKDGRYENIHGTVSAIHNN
jgi:hypothetical protein